MENMDAFEEEIERLIEMKEYEKALEILDEKIANSDSPDLLTLCFIEKAKIMGLTKEPHKMEVNIYNAVNIFYDIKDRNYRGKMALYIGGLFLFLGDTYNALKFYKKALEDLPPDSYDHIRALYNLGEVQKRMGELEEAKEKFSQCYYRARESGMTKIEGYAAENMAEIHMTENKKDEAKKWLGRAWFAVKRGEDRRIRYTVELAIAIVNGDDERVEEIGTLMKNMGMEHDVADTYYYYADAAPSELREKLLKEAVLIYSDLGDGKMKALALRKLES